MPGHGASKVWRLGHLPNPVAVAAPGYLNAVVAPYAVYGAQKLVSGYAGPLFQLVRSSDPVTLDVSPYGTGDYPDYAAINAWARGATLTVSKIYDQTGNGHDLVQATAAKRPSFDTSIRNGNCVPIIVDSSPGEVILKSMEVGSLTLDVIANSAFFAAQLLVSFQPCAIMELTTENGVTSIQTFDSNIEIFRLFSNAVQDITVTNTTTPGPRAIADVFGYSSSDTTGVLWSNDTKRVISRAKTTTAAARIRLSTDTVGGATYYGRYRLLGMAIYNSAVSQADGDTINSSLKTAIGVSRTYPYRVVFGGNSIVEGYYATKLRGLVSQLTLTKNGEVFNCGVNGQTLNTEKTNRIARFSNVYTASYPTIFFCQGGTNDLQASDTAVNVYTYATTLTSYLKGLGYKVVICTILPRANFSGAQETERQSYNTAVIGNAAAADLVLDLNADPIMGGAQSQASNTTYFIDGVHPTTPGHGVQGGLFTTALQTILRTTALGGSYVP